MRTHDIAMQKKWVTITVVSAESLPAGDSNGLSDPYVTIDWSVGNKRLLKTSVKPETLSPEWVCLNTVENMGKLNL